jgi:hypothetical protein
MTEEGLLESQTEKGPRGTTRDNAGSLLAVLKTVVRKDLWVRVPRPPQKWRLTWAFAIPSVTILPD